MILGQYIGIFNQTGWSSRFRDEIPLHLLNRLYLSFALVNETSLYWEMEDRVIQVLSRLRKINPKAEIFASIQDDVALLRGAFDPGFPQKVLRFLQDYRLQGLDLDWEENLKEKPLSRLVKNLSAVLHANKMKLTLSAWPFWTEAYNASVLRTHLDQINLMSYGERMNLAEVIDDFVNHGFPVEKLIAGVTTEWPYPEGTDSLGSDGSIVRKVRIVKKRGLAGAMAWRIDNDYTLEKEIPSYKGAHQLWEAADFLFIS